MAYFHPVFLLPLYLFFLVQRLIPPKKTLGCALDWLGNVHWTVKPINHHNHALILVGTMTEHGIICMPTLLFQQDTENTSFSIEEQKYKASIYHSFHDKTLF